MAFAHRNGETEAPTTPGRYWFKGAMDGWTRAVFTTVVATDKGVMAWNDMSHVDSFTDISQFEGQWWGPVVPPWEQPE